MTDIGLEVVRSVYQKMMIDREWSIWHQRGFTWWGYRLAQHIWADPCFEDQGCVISRIHARTDLLDGFTGSDDQCVSLMRLTPVLTSLSGPARDPGNPSHVQLAANIYVHAGTADWWARVFATIAIMQAEEAHQEVEYLAKAVKARPAYSAHPKSGFRNEWDDILNVPSQLLVPMGQELSRYQGREMLDTLEMLQAPPCVLVTGDEKRFCAEFPFGPLTSLLQVQTEFPHLVLGNGLHMMLQLPEGPDGLDNPEPARKALELNEWEQNARLGPHFLGSWCPAPTLCFLSFFPNGLFASGWAKALAQEAMGRAHWAANDVFQAGWDFEEAIKLKLEISPEEGAALAYAGRAAVFGIPEDMMDKPVTTGMSADMIEALNRAVGKIVNLAATEQKKKRKRGKEERGKGKKEENKRGRSR